MSLLSSSALDKTSGILELPPLPDGDTGKVMDSIFVHGDDGTARWITLDGKDYNDINNSNKDYETDDALLVEMEEQNRLEDLRRFLVAKSESSAKAAAELQQDQQQTQQRNNIDALSSSSNNNKTLENIKASSSSSSSPPDQLWVTRYGAQRFSELLSDERINLEVLQWLMAWKKKVSGGGAAAKKLGKKAAAEPELEKIILLTGPPGVGKTTLAHVVCNHCGFDAIEVNASYSRSAAEMKNLIDTATSDVGGGNTQNMMSAQESSNANDARDEKTKKMLRPKCLILDEIDGSTSNIIKLLFSLNIRRPVMCLANNLYAPVLRELRSRLTFIRQVPPLLPARIVSRLEAIAEKEKIVVDRHSLMDLALHCAGDIRQCLNTLFFVSRQVSNSNNNGNSSSSNNTNASRLLRMIRVREPTVSIWTLWEATMERKEKSKYINNLSSAGVMSREDAAELSVGSSGSSTGNNKVDIGSLWVNHCATKCPELDTVINGLHEWFCQLGFADYNCKATASVAESFAWLDRADPFTGLQYSGISQAVVTNTFRSCATLSARPAHIRNAMPREAGNWVGETQRTKELIAEFLEKPSPFILGSLVKIWATSTVASRDILPVLAKMLSQIPFNLKLAPGVRNLKDVRNMRDADVLKRLVDLLQCFGVSFTHDASSTTNEANANNNNNNSKYPNSKYNNNNSNQQEWKMSPDLEDWSKWKAGKSANETKSTPFYANKLRDPAQGAVRAAAGIKARPPTVWEMNTKTSPSEVRELLVAELALQRLQQGYHNRVQQQHQSQKNASISQQQQHHDAQRRGRAEEEAARLAKSSAASLFTTTTTTTNKDKDTDAGGPTKPTNTADENNKKLASLPPPPPGGYKKDFFGRIIMPKDAAEEAKNAAAKKQKEQQQQQQNSTPSKSSTTAESSSTMLVSSASKLKRATAAAAAAQSEQLLSSVKYRYFDGSSNSVRKGAVYTDFI